MCYGSWPKPQSAEQTWNDDASRSPLELPVHHLQHCAQEYEHTSIQRARLTQAVMRGGGGREGALKAPKVYMRNSTTSKNFTHGRTAGRIVAFVIGFATTAIRRPLLVWKCKAQCAYAFTKCSLNTITAGSSGHQFRK